jgi:hypothetical protein
MRDDPTLIKQGYVPRNSPEKEQDPEQAKDVADLQGSSVKSSADGAPIGGKAALAKRSTAWNEFVRRRPLSLMTRIVAD